MFYYPLVETHHYLINDSINKPWEEISKKYSKAITKILFLKGIKLEDNVIVEIDKDTYNLMSEYV